MNSFVIISRNWGLSFFLNKNFENNRLFGDAYRHNSWQLTAVCLQKLARLLPSFPLKLYPYLLKSYIVYKALILLPMMIFTHRLQAGSLKKPFNFFTSEMRQVPPHYHQMSRHKMKQPCPTKQGGK